MYTFFYSSASGVYPLNGFDSYFRWPDSEKERKWKEQFSHDRIPKKSPWEKNHIQKPT